MNILAVDTATECLAVALAHGDGRICLRVERGLGHAAALLPWIDRILKDAGLSPADLDLLVCTLGPGSFTGIRIALATVKGLGLSCGRPAVGVCTLDAFAWPLRFHDGAVVPVIDARKGRFYASVFRGGAPAAEAQDLAPAELRRIIEGERNPVLAGPDADKVRERLGVAASTFPVYDPSSLLILGVEKYKKEGQAAGDLTPIYLRRSEAEESTVTSRP
jgi:tRNA threonylcarbamoyladenosine biosynthesis protein TsaB